MRSSRFPISAETSSRSISVLVIGISCLVLMGWAFDIVWLKSIRPEWNSMRIVTAICLIIAATGLACLGGEQKWKRTLSQAGAVIICLMALLNLFVYGILIFSHHEPSFVAWPVFNLFLASSDRMAVITALIFLGFGCALLLSSDTRHLAGVGHAILLPVTILSYLALVGYIFNVRELNEWLGVRVAFHTGLALCLLCIGLFCARADTWLMSVLTGEESGGVMARRLMPALVVIPVVVAWLRLYGEHSGLFISEVGVALVAVTNTVVLLWLVWFSAKSVNRTDRLRRQMEADLAESEQRVRQKLLAILSPEGSVGDLELADVIDPAVVQTLMDDFYALTHIPMSLINTRGRCAVGVGWQEICAKYHRAHPEACKNCMESDLILSRDVAPGEFKLYKCKNSMWDIATPIVVGGKFMGSVFCGQFFFEGEEIDIEQFRSQARQYGFNEKKYIDALRAVPRLSRKDVDTGMSFLLKLARIFSQLGYSNATLARSLAERETLMASLSQNQEILRQGEQRLRAILDALPVAVFLSDKDGNVIFTNHAVQLIWGLSEHVSRDSYGAYKGRWLDTHKEVEPDQWALARTLDTGQVYNNDLFEITMDDGERKILFNFALPIRDENGQLTGAVAVTEDVTERVQMEKLFRESQERFRILFQQAAVGIKRLDPRGIYWR